MELHELDLLVDTFKFRYRSLSFADKAAKRLKKAFEHEFEGADHISLGRSRALIAQMTGYSDWENLKASIDPESTDPIDQDMNSRGIIDRRSVLYHRLSKLQKIEPDAARRLVYVAEPTGSKAGILRIGIDGLGGNECLYLMPPVLEQYMNGDEALKNIGVKCPEATSFAGYDYLITNVVEGYRHHGITMHTLAAVQGRGIQIAQYDTPLLNIWYDIYNIVELDAPVFGFNSQIDAIHPNPLRPDRICHTIVRLSLAELEVSKRCSQVAHRAAASFLLSDVMIASLVSGLSVGMPIEAADLEISVNKNDEEMELLAGSVVEEFKNLLDFEHENDGATRLIDEVMPFETINIIER